MFVNQFAVVVLYVFGPLKITGSNKVKFLLMTYAFGSLKIISS